MWLLIVIIGGSDGGSTCPAGASMAENQLYFLINKLCHYQIWTYLCFPLFNSVDGYAILAGTSLVHMIGILFFQILVIVQPIQNCQRARYLMVLDLWMATIVNISSSLRRNV